MTGAATYADTSAQPPARFACDFQPYGRFVLGECEWFVPPSGRVAIAGVVVEGSETTRIGACSSTRDISGERRTVYGVTPAEVEAGECVRIAG